MSASHESPDVQTLLAQGAFVSALARRLLQNEHDAEDLAQDAWTSLVRRSATGARDARAFLAGVVRHLAGKSLRGASRRAEREARAARPERLPSTAAVVAREEWRRRVVERVLDLDPREREVVLLRYFEGVPPHRIARELGVPLATVKSRLRRGVETLRPRLVGERTRDADLAGLALVAFGASAGSPAASSSTHVVRLMSTASKLRVAGLVAFALGALVVTRAYLGGGAPSRDGALAPATSSGPSAMDGSSAPSAANEADSRRAVEGGEPELASPPPAGATLVGRVFDELDRPVAGAEVLAWHARTPSGAPAWRTASDASGRFALEHVLAPVYVEARAPERSPVLAIRGAPVAASTTEDLVLRVAAFARHRVRVVAGGAPVADARVELTLAPVPSAASITAGEDVFHVRPQRPPHEQRTLADGTVSFELPRCEHAIVVEHPEHAAQHAVASVDDHDSETLVELERGVSIEGRVLAADGTPVEGADVRYRARSVLGSARTDAYGGFAIEHVHPEAGAWLSVTAEGHAPLVHEPVRSSDFGGDPLELRLEDPLALAGVVRDPAGEPVPGVTMEIRGDRVVQGNVERPLWTWPTWERLLGVAETRTDASGAFRIDGLYAGEFEIALAWDEDGTPRRQLFHARSGTEDLALVLDPARVDDVCFTGRVTDALTGAPIERFTITVLGLDEKDTTFNSEPILVEREDGRFRVGGLRPMKLALYVSAPGYRDQGSMVEPLDAGVHERDVVLAPVRQLAVRVVDASGEPVASRLTVTGRVSGGVWLVVGEGARAASLATNERGEALLQELPAEVVTVRAHAPDRDSAEIEVDLRQPIEGVREIVVGPPR